MAAFVVASPGDVKLGHLPSTGRYITVKPQLPGNATLQRSSCSLAATVVMLAAGRRKPRTSRNVLGDGTNEEGESVAPLTMKLDEVEDIVLYQQEFSPPCVKLRTMFKYYNLPFRIVNGRHPTSDYKKIPVLVINDRQINDSHVIVKTVVPWFTGRPMTEQEMQWENRITYEFQPAFEVELLGNERDVATIWTRATNFIGGWQRGVIGFLSPILKVVVEALFKSRYPNMTLPSSNFGLEFRRALGDRPFFHGEKPGPVDLSLYGTYAAFNGCSATARFLQASRLEEWHERMVGLNVGDVEEPKVYAMT